MPLITPKEIRDQIVPLHVRGLSDDAISKRLNVGIWTVNKYLINNRVHLKHKKRNYVNAEHAICTICNETKHTNEFPMPRSNGRSLALTEISYCKDCQSKKAFNKRTSSPRAYVQDRLTDLKCRCKMENMPYDLTVEHVLSIYKKQNGRCFYTDVALQLTVGGRLREALSVDRVIPALEYVEGNIALCTYRANAIKQDQTLAELEIWMPMWYARLQKAGFIK